MKNGHLDHKTRMICLRLSEVEYEFLKTRHQSYGARTVSDLARLAVQRLMQGSDNPANMQVIVSAMAESISNLKSRVVTLENQINGASGGRESHEITAWLPVHAGQEDA